MRKVEAGGQVFIGFWEDLNAVCIRKKLQKRGTRGNVQSVLDSGTVWAAGPNETLHCLSELCTIFSLPILNHPWRDLSSQMMKSSLSYLSLELKQSLHDSKEFLC